MSFRLSNSWWVRAALIGAGLVLYAWLSLVDLAVAPEAVESTEAPAVEVAPATPPKRVEPVAPAPAAPVPARAAEPAREPAPRSRYETARRGPEFFDTRRNDY